TSKMDFQLHYWALAILACGLGHPADVRVYIQNVLQITDPAGNAATILWIVPCVAYTLAETDPEQAVELLAWIFAYPNTALSWVHQWPLLDRLQAQLQAVLNRDSYNMHWKKGPALTFDRITTYLQHAFPAAPDAGAGAAHPQLLTAREREILGLLAAGMTNPQITAQLVIGAGTVKTHTLHIYRKLEVANRTQAIVRAQDLGFLRA
ncbi:MAG: LuxR family transcriptional regulator, partial [Chloroflexota bacterium]|nr:LuxR family transcriptional regulator [Chloroflexota bacterium]